MARPWYSGSTPTGASPTIFGRSDPRPPICTGEKSTWPYDTAVGFRRGDQRDRRGARGVQQLDQTRLVPTAIERLQMHFANGRGILGTVRTDSFAHYYYCSFPEKLA
jgi:hypothetical protein